MILRHVQHQHASKCTVMHALFVYYFLGANRTAVARIFHKSVSTVSSWIDRYESSSDYERKKAVPLKKFTKEQQNWVIQFYTTNPIAYLDEAKKAFEVHFKKTISITTVWRIIHNHGFTWKVLERRAMQVRQDDIFRFCHELGSIDWTHHNIEFLDEVSFDTRGMLRKRGYSMKGEKLCFRGEFDRKPRVSLLCFADVTGVTQVFDTVGTFDRHAFVQCCSVHAAECSKYPGKGSIWILDGASIHCHPSIVYFLRSVGIVPIFLPAYCPFFNPIEYVFGLVKKSFRRHYKENATKDLLLFVLGVMNNFKQFDLSSIFHHCGYTIQGRFDQGKQLSSIHAVEKPAVSDDLLGFDEINGD